VPGMAQVLRMATVGGSRTTPYRETLGTLEVGNGADLSLVDWHSISYPFLDELTPTLDAVIYREGKFCTAPGCLDNRLRYAARLKVSSCQVARIWAGLRYPFFSTSHSAL
jgi:cytosine/adenosine deaminase-related metal-dependent hydrolase